MRKVRSIFATRKIEDLHEAGIEFKEFFDPPFDTNDDYRVVYEASFEPNTLEKARLEFWVTDTGHVAVGVETYERISRRLGLKSICSGFAAGQEPTTASKEGLQILFDAVRMGRILISAKTIFWLVSSARLLMEEKERATMAYSGYETSWISTFAKGSIVPHSSDFRKVLTYRSW